MARPKKITAVDGETTLEEQAENLAEIKETDPHRLIDCEVWKAKVEFKYRIDENTGEKERYVSQIIKVGTAPIKTTSIEARHMIELNSHVENSNLYYYEI